MRAGADMALNGGTAYSTCGDTGHSLIDTMYLGQRIDMVGGHSGRIRHSHLIHINSPLVSYIHRAFVNSPVPVLSFKVSR